mgnify:CR=1 FL=1
MVEKKRCDLDINCEDRKIDILNTTVLKEKNKGTTLGYIGSTNCSNDCPESCTHWYIWNTDMWEQDPTLTVQCATGK